MSKVLISYITNINSFSISINLKSFIYKLYFTNITICYLRLVLKMKLLLSIFNDIFFLFLKI